VRSRGARCPPYALCPPKTGSKSGNASLIARKALAISPLAAFRLTLPIRPSPVSFHLYFTAYNRPNVKSESYFTASA
jgi:hypothetical protein